MRAGLVTTLKRVVAGVAAHPAAVGTAIAALFVGGLATRFLFENERTLTRTKLLPPDTPPAEYLYLDSDRVLAYLGQIQGGLNPTEKRTVLESESQTGSLKGGLVGEVSGSAERRTSIESTVTPAATDRFFSLLIALRSGREEREDRSSPWLHELDARLKEPSGGARVRKQLENIHEGDFVRISNARLYLAPYAAVTPRARYAASYLGGDIKEPRQPAYAPLSADSQRNLKRYLLLLGADPVLPFVVPTLTTERVANEPVTFFVPARYSGLLDNARLLTGNLTIVGKVIYLDSRLASSPECAEVAQGVACNYIDRETLTTFGPALTKAPHSVLASLGLAENEVLSKVTASVTFAAPLVVVLPVAIYQ
jgi:hypothetical protein